jgi:hypothetical protein
MANELDEARAFVKQQSVSHATLREKAARDRFLIDENLTF